MDAGKRGPRTGLHKLWVVAAIIAMSVTAAAALLALVGGHPFPSVSPVLRPDDARVTNLGRQVYAAHCAACHGQRLEGQANWQQRDAQGRLPAPPHDATGHTWHHADELLFRLTKFGVAKAANLPGYDSTMPAYEGVLSDEQIVAVLSWIKSQWPPDIRAKHDQVNRAARSTH